MRRRSLGGSSVVLTGATSGAGRATAEAFARHGARLVLAARDETSLDEVAAKCRALGAAAVVPVATDISSPQSLERLREVSLGAYGRIDTWVNAAAVLLAGTIDVLPVDEIDRLIDINIGGTFHASRVAMQQFSLQGDGVLINVSSVLGLVPNPYVPAYTMSKFAVLGLSLALHHARQQYPGVRVCAVLPGPLDTPMFERAANYTGRRLRSVPPACAPERAAAAIIACARKPRRVAMVGVTARLISVSHRVAPGFTEWAVATYSGTLLRQRVAAPETRGDLYGWSGSTAIHGRWRKSAIRRRAGAAFGRTLAAR